MRISDWSSDVCSSDLCKMVAHFAVIVEIVDVDIRVVVDLHVGGAFAVIRYGFYIYALKAYLQLISAWYDIHAEHKIQYKDDGCRHHIRPNEAVETHPATQNRHNLRLVGHFRCKEDNGDKIDQW